jgi:hypothetical protein
MALDSADKRFSMIGVGLDFLRVRPTPDGTVDTTDRLHFLPLYRGIAASILTTAIADITVRAKAFIRYIRAHA